MSELSLPLTEKEYDRDAYTRSFTGRVLSIVRTDETHVDVVLDRTVFFPEEGGQCCDGGTLGGFPVAHVTLSHGVITHTLLCSAQDALPQAGDALSGEIDWQIRLRNMQVHSGEHVLSGALYQKYGFANVGFHLGALEVTADFDGMLSPAEWKEIETHVNNVIRENHPITCFYPDAETLANTFYRAKREVEGPLRLVQIGQDGCIDVCACCAPHVAHTGEIGLLKILRTEHYKGGTRVWFAAGPDALTAFQARVEQEDAISARWSIKQGELEAAFAKMDERLYAAQGMLKKAQERMATMAVAAATPLGCVFYVWLEGMDVNRLRDTGNRILASYNGDTIKVVALFSLRDDGKTTDYVLLSREGGINLREVAPQLNAALCGRGGGSPAMIQGSVTADKAAVDTWFASSALFN